MAAALVTLIANALLPHPHLPVLFVAAALLASLNSVHRPAIEAMTPQLVRQEEMTAVSALNSIRGNAAFIAGPGLGGPSQPPINLESSAASADPVERNPSLPKHLC